MSWSKNPGWSSATTTPSWNAAASGSSSTTARSTSIMLPRCWCRCSWTRTSPSWCPRPTPGVRRLRSRTRSRPCRYDTASWQVIRKAGTEIPGAARTKLSRRRRQLPTGFDPTVWGISQDMANSIDRVALWNIVATVDAFLSAGFTPTELMLGASEPGGQHTGHRHGRHDVDADHVPRQPGGTSPTTSCRKCCRMSLPPTWFSRTSAATAR